MKIIYQWIIWISFLQMRPYFASEAQPETENNTNTFSDPMSDWLTDHLRYFNTMKYSYNWTERLPGYEPDTVFTVVLSVFVRSWYPLTKFGATFLHALTRFVDREETMRNYYFDLVLVNHGCDEYSSIASLLDLQAVHIDALIGQRCASANLGAGYYLTYHDVPIMSTGAFKPDFGDKETFSTLMRMPESYQHMGNAFIELFRRYGWGRIATLGPVGYNRCEQGIQSIKEAFRGDEHLLLAEWILEDMDTLSDKDMTTILKNLKERSRVILLCVDDEVLLPLMRKAASLGMVTPDYVYIMISERVDDLIRWPWGERSASISDREWRDQRDLFQYMLFLTFPELSSAEDMNLSEYVNKRSQEPPFNHDLVLDSEALNSDRPLRELISVYNGAYQWLLAVNASLADGTDPRSGRNIFSKTVNATFEGNSGKVYMDANADKLPTYHVWQVNARGNQFEHCADVDMKKPFGQRLNYVEGRSIVWRTDDGKPPPAVPACGFFRELCPPSTAFRDTLIGVGFGSVLLLILTLYLIAIFVKKRKFDDELSRMLWKIDIKDIEFNMEGRGSKHGRSLRSLRSHLSLDSHHASATSAVREQVFTNVALYKGQSVALKKVRQVAMQMKKQHLVELKQVKDLSHENINSLVGVCIGPADIYILTQYCAKGSLQDVLENDEIKLDKMFKTSLISDLVNGMKYIHDSPIGFHGNLKSNCCLIDSRWMLKICGFGLGWLRSPAETEQTYKEYKAMLWRAPELLRTNPAPGHGTKKGDVYSFAIILQEIIFRAHPFFTDERTPQEIVELVKQSDKQPFRPTIAYMPPETDEEVLDIMKECWNEVPDERPSFSEVKKKVIKANKGVKVNILDTMVLKLEKYANNLEEIVDKRTEELLHEKKKTDDLLYRMLPSVVAEKLKKGETVSPELYESATVYFSDIVGFTSLSSRSTPMQVVDFLNQLYSCFDDIIATFDIYKVETIGDAYMCVSGIPKRNGSRHIAEIADMALAIKHAVAGFSIPHLQDTELQIRIGIHSGPCAAGVVGLTMPRYCLFGDTVNTASRMESNSMAMKIHLSSPAQAALVEVGRYDTTCRGEIEIKGKGTVTTYWLEGKHD